MARLAGVGVTWLPRGFFVEGPSVKVTSGGTSAVQDFRGNAGAAPAHRLTLRVDRGPPPVLTQEAGKDVTVASTKIRGHDVRVTTIAGNSPEIPGDLYSLDWAESAGVHLEVMASFGASLDDAKRMAAGLQFHASDAAIAAPAGEAAIRSAFAEAYAWSASVATVLGAVENGSSLSTTLAALKERDPEIVRTMLFAVHDVTFSDSHHASVSYSLSYQGSTSNAAIGAAIQGEQGAVKVGGTWKVAQQGFCSVVKLTGVGCP